jgi:hypothetical protein
VSSISTIELGVRELRVAQADAGRLSRSGLAALPEDAYQDSIPTAALTRSLIATLKTAGITAKRARVAISDAGIAVRDFRLPPLSPAELTKAVTYEGKRVVPMDPNDVYFAWHTQRDRSGYAVYLVAARREMIDAITRVVATAGLQVERIDLKALALARGAGAADGMVVDWGTGEGTLVFLEQARPHFFRSFALESNAEDFEAQLEEMALSVNALVRFMRTAEPHLLIGPSTPLYLTGRFALLPAAADLTRRRFPFQVRWPSVQPSSVPGFPWQMHLAAAGLLGRPGWKNRLTPTQRGEVHAAA